MTTALAPAAPLKIFSPAAIGPDFWEKRRRFFTALLAVCLPFSIGASNVAWALMALAYTLSLFQLKAPGRYRRTGLEAAWLVYLAVSFLSAAFAEEPARAFRKLTSELSILIFFIGAQAMDKVEARRVLNLFLVSIGAASLWGWLQYSSGVNWNSFTDTLTAPAWAQGWPSAFLQSLATRNGRALGFYSHPLTYAEVLLLAWPVLVWGALTQGATRRRLLSGAGAFVCLGAIVWSESRGAWLALAATVFVWAVVPREKKMVGLLAGLLVAAALAGAVSPSLRQRALSLLHPAQDVSGMTRVALWQEAVLASRDAPALGVGKGHVRLQAGGANPPKTWTETHSIYIQMLLERGALGFAAFLAYLLAMGRLFWRAGKNGASWGFFYGFLGLALAGVTESWTHDAEVMMCLYFLLAVAGVLGADPADKSTDKRNGHAA